MGRAILGLVMLLSVVGPQAWAASGGVDSAREKARKLAKEGRTLEAASELRGAADDGGSEGPSLRFEAGLMLQRSGELRDAQTLYDQVSGDSSANFKLRVRARTAREVLFWVLELSSLGAPALDRLSVLKDAIDEADRRVQYAESSGKELGKRLKSATQQVAESHASLKALVGPGDPMIRELAGLVKDCGAQKKSVAAIKKSMGAAKQALASAKKTHAKIAKAIDGLVAVANKQVERAKQGGGTLKGLKKHHDDVTKAGVKVASAALGKLTDVGEAVSEFDRLLNSTAATTEEVEAVISAAEIVLGGAP